MKIKNAKIKNVTMKLDTKNRLLVSMEIHERIGFTIIVFRLINPVEVENLTKLMEYANVREAKELEGKIIRVGMHNDCLTAIGDPVEDRFVDITNTIIGAVKELSESQLLEEYPETE